MTASTARYAGTSRRAPLAWCAAGGASAVAVGLLAGHDPLLAVAVLAVLATSYLVVVSPLWGVVILVALTPVTSGIKPGLIAPHLRPNEVLIIWLVPLVVAAARRPVRPWGRIEWLGVAYAAATALLGSVDVLRDHSGFTSQAVNGLLGPIEYLLLFRAVRVTVRTAQDRDVVLRTLLLAAVPICALALAQGFGVGWAQHLRDSLTGGNPGHLNRATGLYSNWQVLAGYLLSVGLLAVSVAAHNAAAILNKRAAWLIALLIGAALARTLTIGAFVGWVIGSMALVAMGRRVQMTAQRVVGVIVLAVAAVIAVLAARYQQEFVARAGQSSNGLLPNTVADRFHNWSDQIFPALAGKWGTGAGPVIPSTVSFRYTDSVYLTMLLRGGVALLAVYGVLVAGFVSVARNARAALPSAAAAASALLVLVLVLIPLQVVATYFTTSGLPEVIWILAAAVSTIGTSPSVP